MTSRIRRRTHDITIASHGQIRRRRVATMLSGVVNGPGAERLNGLDVSGVIGKPFDPAALADQVMSRLVPR